jgi:hypothetical protein
MEASSSQNQKAPGQINNQAYTKHTRRPTTTYFTPRSSIGE